MSANSLIETQSCHNHEPSQNANFESLGHFNILNEIAISIANANYSQNLSTEQLIYVDARKKANAKTCQLINLSSNK